MIASMNSWVRELIALLVLAGLVDFFVPAGKMRRYVKLVMGIFILLAILGPLFRVLEQPPDLQALLPVETTGLDLQAVTAQAERFRQQNEGLVAQELKRNLAAEAERLAQGLPGVVAAHAEVTITELHGVPALTGVKLTIETDEADQPVARVEPVRVGGEPQAPTGRQPVPVLQQVRGRVATELGLPEAQVEVYLRSQ